MKIPRENPPNQVRRPRKRQQQRREREENDGVNELLKICLQKICELQADLERDEEEQTDPEAAGYAACALEALRFLAAEGLAPNHPLVKTLQDRLMGDKR